MTKEFMKKFVAVWRGYHVRKQWELHGPGVLDRRRCHNETEMATGEEAHEIPPESYFAFEEGGRVYWFHQASLRAWTADKLHPLNPYTRTPLTRETRQRLRMLVPEDKVNSLNDVACRLQETGFATVSPSWFTELNACGRYHLLQGIARRWRMLPTVVRKQLVDPKKAARLAGPCGLMQTLGSVASRLEDDARFARVLHRFLSIGPRLCAVTSLDLSVLIVSSLAMVHPECARHYWLLAGDMLSPVAPSH
jgi:hypothetical protein